MNSKPYKILFVKLLYSQLDSPSWKTLITYGSDDRKRIETQLIDSGSNSAKSWDRFCLSKLKVGLVIGRVQLNVITYPR